MNGRERVTNAEGQCHGGSVELTFDRGRTLLIARVDEECGFVVQGCNRTSVNGGAVFVREAGREPSCLSKRGFKREVPEIVVSRSQVGDRDQSLALSIRAQIVNSRRPLDKFGCVRSVRIALPDRGLGAAVAALFVGFVSMNGVENRGAVLREREADSFPTKAVVVLDSCRNGD